MAVLALLAYQACVALRFDANCSSPRGAGGKLAEIELMPFDHPLNLIRLVPAKGRRDDGTPRLPPNRDQSADPARLV